MGSAFRESAPLRYKSSAAVLPTRRRDRREGLIQCHFWEYVHRIKVPPVITSAKRRAWNANQKCPPATDKANPDPRRIVSTTAPLESSPNERSLGNFFFPFFFFFQYNTHTH